MQLGVFTIEIHCKRLSYFYAFSCAVFGHFIFELFDQICCIYLIFCYLLGSFFDQAQKGQLQLLKG